MGITLACEVGVLYAQAWFWYLAPSTWEMIYPFFFKEMIYPLKCENFIIFSIFLK